MEIYFFPGRIVARLEATRCLTKQLVNSVNKALQHLIVPLLFKYSGRFYATGRSITLFTVTHNRPLCWAIWIQPTSFYPFLGPNLFLFFNLILFILRRIFRVGFPTKILFAFLFSLQTFKMSFLSYPPKFYRTKYIWKLDFFYWLNLSIRTMVLGSTQPLT